jgi:hypothetical protein
MANRTVDCISHPSRNGGTFFATPAFASTQRLRSAPPRYHIDRGDFAMRVSDGTIRLPAATSFRWRDEPRAIRRIAPPAPFFRRWFRRREPTVFHRCLAVHIHFAGPRSALS